MDYSNLTKEYIIDGIKKENIYFENLSEQWKDNKEVVLEAVKKDGIALYYVSERLRNDKEIILEAVKDNGQLLFYAAEDLKDDKEVVLLAVKNDGWSLKYVSERLQSDKELLEVLENSKYKEKSNYSSWSPDNKKWYENKMEVLANIREKEFMETSITVINIKPKKIKF